MLQYDQKYIPGFNSQRTRVESDWVLVIQNKKLLMRKDGDKFIIPIQSELVNIISINDVMEYIGSYDGHDCYCTDMRESFAFSENFELVEIREITKVSGDPGLFRLTGNAHHILHWRRINRYCGCCGHKTITKEDERAIVCPDCGNIIYPRISPATITAIFHEDKILLAHNRNFREGLYSLVAGFVEPGETLEQCVGREIQEEIGINIKNIKYFSSQPWPFPDSLMLAFTAEYESGELSVDNCEITDAAWYHADSLPDIPAIDSIAGKMIRWYRDQYIK